MKGIRLFIAMALMVGLLACGVRAQGEDESDSEEQQVPVVEQTTESLSLQEQIDALKAEVRQLREQLADTEKTHEKITEDVGTLQDKTAKSSWAEKVKVSGYIQSQFTYDRAGSHKSDFLVRRGRLKLDAQVTDQAALTLQIDAARDKVELKDAYVDIGRKSDPWRFRTGQSKVPFMYEVLESSSTRLEPERTAMAQVLFPSERDIGAWLLLKNALGDSVPATTLDLGVMNGNGPNTKGDADGRKDVIARLRFALGNQPVDKNTEANSVYLAYQQGSLTDSKGVETDKRYIGGGVSYVTGPLWLRGEMLYGERSGKDFRGWYAHAAYAIPETRDTLFARYEYFDENRDVTGDLFRNWTAGWQHELDERTRVVLAHDFRNPEKSYSSYTKTNGGLTTIRLQVKY